ncbi:MAG TPA: AIR synthase-related protein, partial [Fimbriimonadaceae bacterium]|nr:AIR synthase-related protein [Fimbriimonadaceae bacterium]
IASMSTLNKEASERGLSANVRCATDITGFGLAGHLFNVARGSGVQIEIDTAALPVLPGVIRMIEENLVTGGATKNRLYLGDALQLSATLPRILLELVLDPQTSGGLALFSPAPIEGFVEVGRVLETGTPAILLA